jgi:flagellar motor switch/type III secretory pathway protein FliN
MFSDQTARELAWWPDHVLDSVGRRVGAAWQTWHNDWVPGPGGASELVTARRAHEAEAARRDRHWLPLGCHGAASAWLASASEQVLVRVQEMLFGRVPVVRDQSLARLLAERATKELTSALRVSLQLTQPAQNAPEPWLFTAWSGAVLLQLPVAGGGLELLLAPECVAAMPDMAARPSQAKAIAQPLAAMSQAVSNSQIRLEARIGEIEIELGTLAQLAEGDVIALPLRVDEPLLLTDSSGKPFLRGFLGSRDQHKAIQLVSAGPSSAPAP